MKLFEFLVLKGDIQMSGTKGVFSEEDLPSLTVKQKWEMYQLLLETHDWFVHHVDSTKQFEEFANREELIIALRDELSPIDAQRATDLFDKNCPYRTPNDDSPWYITGV